MIEIKKKTFRKLVSKNHSFYYVVPLGWEKEAAAELKELIPELKLKISDGGLSFQSNLNCIEPIHQYCQSGIRLLLRINSFPCLSEKQLHKHIQEIPFPFYIPIDSKIEFKITLKSSWLYNEKKAAHILESAFQKYYPAFDYTHTCGKKTSIIYIRLSHNKLTISLDLTGEPLYKSFLLPNKNLTPLRENYTASAFQLIENYQPDIIYDPFCGSGTLLIQYYFSANPEEYTEQKQRSYSYANLPFNNHLIPYKPIKKNKQKKNIFYLGQDILKESLSAFQKNIQLLKNFQCSLIQGNSLSFSPIFSKEKKILLFSNPPYGWKLENKETAEKIADLFIEKYKQNKNIQLALFFPSYKKLDKICRTKNTFPYGGKKITFYSTIKAT